jgi:tetratricopeptide (TPR) repeat protein
VPNTRGWLLFDLGLVEEALDADEEALEECRARPEVGTEPTIQTLLNLARDHLALHRPDRAEACLAEAGHLAAGTEVAWYRFTNRLEYLRGEFALRAGDVDATLAAVEATAAMADRFDAPRYRIRAQILEGRGLLAAGRRDDGLHRLRAAVRAAQERGFAILAEEAHRLLGRHFDSAHHRRRADHWWGQIVASVDEPLRSRVVQARRLKPF